MNRANLNENGLFRANLPDLRGVARHVAECHTPRRTIKRYGYRAQYTPKKINPKHKRGNRADFLVTRRVTNHPGSR